MSWLSSAIDFVAGNPNQGKMNNILNKNMGQYTSGLQDMSGQMQGLANQSFDFNSGINQMQRGLLNQQRLGQGFLNSSANILNQAGEIQSNINTGMANVEADKAANRGKLARGAIGLIAGAY